MVVPCEFVVVTTVYDDDVEEASDVHGTVVVMTILPDFVIVVTVNELSSVVDVALVELDDSQGTVVVMVSVCGIVTVSTVYWVVVGVEKYDDNEFVVHGTVVKLVMLNDVVMVVTVYDSGVDDECEKLDELGVENIEETTDEGLEITLELEDDTLDEVPTELDDDVGVVWAVEERLEDELEFDSLEDPEEWDVKHEKQVKLEIVEVVDEVVV